MAFELADLKKEAYQQRYESVYRLYHQSFKVYRLQDTTIKIVTLLQSLLPERPLNKWFKKIVEDGTGIEFQTSHNDAWLCSTRPIFEAFSHALYFLDVAHYRASNQFRIGFDNNYENKMLSVEYAGLLYLFNLR